MSKYMLNGIFISGVFSGILSVFCLMKIINATSGVEKKSNIEKKNFQKVVYLAKTKKKKESFLLAQCNSRFDLLIERYKKMTLAEIHEEIGKIEKEKRGDVTGRVLEAVALEVLFLQWKKLEPTGFDNYRTESDSKAVYYFNNPASKAKSWSELVVQIWAERKPESASQYICEYWDEVKKDGLNPDKTEERQISYNEFDFEMIMQRVAYAMGRHSADTALEWAGKMNRISPRLQFYVIQSIISNHPEKVAAIFSHIEEVAFPRTEREQCLSELVRQWRMADPETADQWLTTCSKTKCNELNDIFKKEKSMDNLGDAIRYFEETDETARKELQLFIIEQFAQKDPAGILDWVLKSTIENEMGKWVDKLKPQSERAFQKLKKYVVGMSPGEDRFRMTRLLESSAHDGYATVDDMIAFKKLSLETEELHPDVLDEVVTSWMTIFPWKQVVQVINESNLSPELKRKYIEKSPSLMDKRPE